MPFGRIDLVVRAVRVEAVGDRVEDEELALRPDVRRVGDAGRAEIGLGVLRDPAWVARVGQAGDGVDDLADHGEGRLGRERVERRGLRLRHQQHVALRDALPAADRGAVEAETFVERLFAEGSQRQRHVLPLAEQVAELEVDHLCLRLGGPLECLRGRSLGADVVPRVVDHRRPFPFGP